MKRHERQGADKEDCLVFDRSEDVLDDHAVLEQLERVVSDNVAVSAPAENGIPRPLNPAIGIVRGVLIGLCLWILLLFVAGF